jgi:hypothetical protein
MRKEIFLAIVVGILAGLGVTYLIYNLRQSMLRSSTPSEIEQSRQQEPTPTPTSSSLVIKQPVVDFLTDQDSVQVVGMALPNSFIVVLAPSGEYISTADQDGDFAIAVPLMLGGNKLTIVATTPDGQQETAVATAVYSTAEIPQSATPSGGAQ